MTAGAGRSRATSKAALGSETKVTLTGHQRQMLLRLLGDEYNRIDALPTDELEGFTIGAKVASLVDVVQLARVLGASDVWAR